jgi:hypothetical protein
MALTFKSGKSGEFVYAYLFPQKLAASTKGSAIGTNSMINCTGVIIHNSQGKCGVTAHVEARSDDLVYLACMHDAFELMMTKLNNIGGKNGPVDVVLMGNGLGSVLYTEMLADKIPKWTGLGNGPRLLPSALFDLRNTRTRMQGTGVVSIELAHTYGAFVYNPAEGTLWVDIGHNIGAIGTKPTDVDTFAIQFG